jgi:hypothetical protein
LPKDRLPAAHERRRLEIPFTRDNDMTQLRLSPGRRWLTIALLLCAPLGVAFAQVARVSGTLSNGGTITITGSGFGTKTNAKPLYYWDFNTSTSTSPLGRGTFPTDDFAGTLSNALVAPGSRMALRRDVGGASGAMGPGSSSGVPFNSPELYVWVKKYYGFGLVTDAGANGMNLKFFRIWHVWTHDTYNSYQASRGLNSGAAVCEQTETITTWWDMPHEGNRWLTEEWEYRQGDVNERNGQFNFTRDAVSGYPRTTRFLQRTSGFPEGYDHFFFDQISNNQISAGKYLYFDSIYVDDTWQRVIISDEPTWQNAVYPAGSKRLREIQVPTAWTNSQITVRVRQGGLASLQNSYLYVINTAGDPISTTGFPLSGLVAGPPPKTPSAPTAAGAQ